MNKQEHNAMDVAREMTRAHGISSRQTLELAREGKTGAENDPVTIDGETATREQATRLHQANLIERCTAPDCPHDYHMREGLKYQELLNFLARKG